MLLSRRKNGLDSLFKEVRVLKASPKIGKDHRKNDKDDHNFLFEAEYDWAKVPPYNGNDPTSPLEV